MFDAANSAAGADVHNRIDSAVAHARDTDPTGDVNVIVAGARRRLDPINHFVVLFYENMDAILKANERALSPRTLRVLFHLLKRAQFGNLVLYSSADLGRALGLDRAGVSRSLKTLHTIGILIDLPEGGTYLNPQVITKGSLLAVSENDPLMYASIADVQRRGAPVSLGTPEQLTRAGVIPKFSKGPKPKQGGK